MSASTRHPERLTAVGSTMLLTLHFRQWDNAKPNPIVGDGWAGDLLTELRIRGHRAPLAKRAGFARYGPLLRARRLDLWTLEYLREHPDTVVLHLGCGLDSRPYRLPIPDATQWYDLDMPDVIELRRELYPPRPNITTIGSSVTDPDWIQRHVPAGRRTLVIAEGLLMYLEPDQVAELARDLVAHAGDEGELWFDSLPASFVNLPVARILPVNRLFRWGLSGPDEPEQWDPRLRVAEQAPIMTDHALTHQASARFALRHLSRTELGRRLLQVTRASWGQP